MKVIIRALIGVAILPMIAGCFVATINGRASEHDEMVMSGGHYSISLFDDGGVGLDKEELLINKELKAYFAPAEDSIPIALNVIRTKIDPEDSWGEVVNGLISACTFFGWPLGVSGCTYKYEITVSFGQSYYAKNIVRSRVANVYVDEDRWGSLWTPLGLVPALFADANVFFVEEPGGGDFMKAYDDVARALIPIAVRSLLLKKDYDEYFADKWKADADAKAKAEEESMARLKERETQVTARQEELIRAFAIKDAPVIWQTVQDLRGQLQTMDSNLAQLKEALVEFDRDPDRDPDYTRICKMRLEVKANLDSLYAKLKDAYIAAKKYEATPGQKELENRHRKTLEDGIREAEMAAKRFKEMSRDK